MHGILYHAITQYVSSLVEEFFDDLSNTLHSKKTHIRFLSLFSAHHTSTRTLTSLGLAIAVNHWHRTNLLYIHFQQRSISNIRTFKKWPTDFQGFDKVVIYPYIFICEGITVHKLTSCVLQMILVALY